MNPTSRGPILGPVAFLLTIGLAGTLPAQGEVIPAANVNGDVIIEVRLPDGSPAAGVRAIHHVQFRTEGPSWMPFTETDDQGNSRPIVTDAKGMALIPGESRRPNSSPTCWLLTEDESLGAVIGLDAHDLRVVLTPMYRVRSCARSDQAKRLGLPFLRRGYFFVGDLRIGHIVGDHPEALLPMGSYRLTSYDGNRTNVLADVPKFEISFEVDDSRDPKVEILNGGATHEKAPIPAEAKVIDLGMFKYAPGDVTLLPNKLAGFASGPVNATIKFKNREGKPYPKGAPILIRNSDFKIIYYGPLLEDGLLKLPGLEASSDGYRIEIDGFTPYEGYKMKFSEGTETLEIDMPEMPGDAVSNWPLLEVESREPFEISSLRGKVVYVELWARWCGPCIGAMNSIQEALADDVVRWGDKAVLLAVNVDGDPSAVIGRLGKQMGWTVFTHKYGGAEGKADWSAPILKHLQLRGIPHALLIGPDGVIRWRGHPSSIDLGEKIDGLLATPGSEG